MCKHAVISSIAAPRRVESAKGFGKCRRPVFGSSGAVIIVGLIHCGQRCDLECVIVTMLVISAILVRNDNGACLPYSLRVAVVGVVQDVFEQGLLFIRMCCMTRNVPPLPVSSSIVLLSSLLSVAVVFGVSADAKSRTPETYSAKAEPHGDAW